MYTHIQLVPPFQGRELLNIVKHQCVQLSFLEHTGGHIVTGTHARVFVGADFASPLLALRRWGRCPRERRALGLSPGAFQVGCSLRPWRSGWFLCAQPGWLKILSK